jgi:hypothetical protein
MSFQDTNYNHNAFRVVFTNTVIANINWVARFFNAEFTATKAPKPCGRFGALAKNAVH